ncbi:MAG: FtsX-like permease family protein, partial [Bacteroidota bacterium]
KQLIVRGVIEDLPNNQHFGFDFISSLENFDQYPYDKGRWGSNNYRCYLVLKEGTDPKAFEKKLSLFDTEVKAAYRNLPFYPTYYLQPLLDIHLHSHINMEIEPNGDIVYIYFFASIAFIILLIAAINYTNLAIASSAQRAKEVGLRKVLGARKGQLIFQFLGESFLLTLLSFAISLCLVRLLLPFFNELLGQEIPFEVLDDSYGILIGMFSLAILIGGLSGLYPAFYLSRVPSVESLKGGILKLHKKGNYLKNTLVIGQFVAAIVLAVASLVVFLQLTFTQDKKLGYEREQIVYVTYRTNNTNMSDRTESVRYELSKHPGVLGVSFVMDVPLNSRDQGFVENWEGNPGESSFNIYRNYVDYDFLDVFEIELVEGRNFSPDFPSDSTRTYLLNQAALEQMGWETAVGKEFNNGRVIGVVKDFHFQPFKLAIEPMFIRFFSSIEPNYANIAIKIDAANHEESLAHIQKTLAAFAPQVPLEYKFLDESYEQLYGSEQRLGKVFNLFTLLAIFISSMGALGLVSYQVLQRTKEIGVRKVLGASTLDIVSLLSKDFLKLVLIANLIAIPIAWYGMRSWLANFAYSIELEWWMFSLVGMLALVFAFLVVSSQTFRAAISRPVHALRDE